MTCLGTEGPVRDGQLSSLHRVIIITVSIAVAVVMTTMTMLMMTVLWATRDHTSRNAKTESWPLSDPKSCAPNLPSHLGRIPTGARIGHRLRQYCQRQMTRKSLEEDRKGQVVMGGVEVGDELGWLAEAVSWDLRSQSSASGPSSMWALQHSWRPLNRLSQDPDSALWKFQLERLCRIRECKQSQCDALGAVFLYHRISDSCHPEITTVLCWNPAAGASQRLQTPARYLSPPSACLCIKCSRPGLIPATCTPGVLSFPSALGVPWSVTLSPPHSGPGSAHRRTGARPASGDKGERSGRWTLPWPHGPCTANRYLSPFLRWFWAGDPDVFENRDSAFVQASFHVWKPILAQVGTFISPWTGELDFSL